MSKNIVFITAVSIPGQESRSYPYKFGIQSWEHWCKKNDAELIVCDQLLFPVDQLKVNFHRYYAFDVLDHNGIDYDQILISDADCIVHPDVPNFFNLTDKKYTVTRSIGDVDWMIRGIEHYSKYLFNGQTFDFCKRYFNSGFQVVNKNHRYIFEKMMKFYFDNKDTIQALQSQFGTGVDQVLVNMIVNLELNDSEMKYLPYEYCATHLHRIEVLENFKFLQCFPGIYQFNGIPNNENAALTNYFMEQTYKRLFNEHEKI